MIETGHGGSVLIRVTGTASRRDVDLAAPEIDTARQLIRASRKLLIRPEDVGGWRIGGFGTTWRSACSTGTRSAALAAPVTVSELRFSPREREDAARGWLGMTPGGGAEQADHTGRSTRVWRVRSQSSDRGRPTCSGRAHDRDARDHSPAELTASNPETTSRSSRVIVSCRLTR